MYGCMDMTRWWNYTDKENLKWSEQTLFQCHVVHHKSQIVFALWQPTRAVEVSRSHSDTPLGRIPHDEWWASLRDLALTSHNTHKRQTSMSPAGFEPATPARKQPHTHSLDCAATKISKYHIYRPNKKTWLHVKEMVINCLSHGDCPPDPWHNMCLFNYIIA